MAVNTLATNVIAKTAVFESRMRRARGTLKSFSMQAKASKVSFGSMALGITATLTTAIYTLKQAADAVLFFVGAASKAEEATNAFNVVFGKASDSAAEFARHLSHEVGRSVWEVRENLVAFQDTLVPLGATREQAAMLSKNLTKLAIDVGSLRNKLDADVVNNFQSAIVGNVRAVRQYGIVLSQARLRQVALEEGFKGGLDSLNGLNKSLLRALLITRDSRDSMGDAAATAGTWANQTKRLAGNWTDFSTALGTEALPEATRGLQRTNIVMESLLKSTQKIGDAIFRIINGFMGMQRLVWLPLRFVIASMSTGFAVILNTLTNILTAFLKIANLIPGINTDGLVQSIEAANDAVAEFAARRLVGFNKQFDNMVGNFKNAFGQEGVNRRRIMQQRAQERAQEAENLRRERQAAADQERFMQEQNRQAAMAGKSTGAPKTRELSGAVTISGLSIGSEFTMIGKLQTMIDQNEVTNTLLQKIKMDQAAGTLR